MSQNAACATDDDCHSARSWCLYEGRVDCTGAFYFNRDLTTGAFEALDDELTRCLWGDDLDEVAHDCGHCNTTESPPACNNGACGPEASL